MGNRRFVKAAAVLCGLALVTAACGDDSDSSGDTTTTGGGGEVQELSIAFVGPLTGGAANLGIYIRDGAKVAVDQFNEEHGDEFNITHGGVRHPGRSRPGADGARRLHRQRGHPRPRRPGVLR